MKLVFFYSFLIKNLNYSHKCFFKIYKKESILSLTFDFYAIKFILLKNIRKLLILCF